MFDLWGRRWLSSQGVKQGNMPPPITIPRPDEFEERKRRQQNIVTDPAKIRQFFQQSLSG